jgi:bifunctional DNase/RNase
VGYSHIPAGRHCEKLGVSASSQDEYVPVRLEKVGFVDETGLEGIVVLTSLVDEKKKLYMRAFSGEVATHIERFSRGDRSSIPSVYNLVEDIAERDGLHLASVKVYNSNTALRSDITFDGREKQVVLEGYRASDSVALAILYDAPILVQSSLLAVEPAES